MSENHATPPRPTPTPFCAIFEPMLPLLRSDGLSADERASLEEHLADCAWCQNRLATLDVVDAALRRHYASVPAAPAGSGSRRTARPTLSLEDIMQADQEETNTATTPQEPPAPLRQLTPRQRQLTALGAIAAVLALAVLAASLFAYLGTHPPGPVAKPTPTIDPQVTGYATLLRTYYTPVASDLHATGTFYTLLNGYYSNNNPALKQNAQQVMIQERPVLMQDELHLQALLDHLPAAPPTQLLHDNALLKQAAQENLTTFQTLDSLAAKQDLPDFWSTLNIYINGNEGWYCTPIAHINTLLPDNAQLPALEGCSTWAYPTPPLP